MYSNEYILFWVFDMAIPWMRGENKMSNLIYKSFQNKNTETVNELESIGREKGLTILRCSAFKKIKNAWAFFNSEGQQKTIGMSLDGWSSRLCSGLSFDEIYLNR